VRDRQEKESLDGAKILPKKFHVVEICTPLDIARTINAGENASVFNHGFGNK